MCSVCLNGEMVTGKIMQQVESGTNAYTLIQSSGPCGERVDILLFQCLYRSLYIYRFVWCIYLMKWINDVIVMTLFHSVYPYGSMHFVRSNRLNNIEFVALSVIFIHISPLLFLCFAQDMLLFHCVCASLRAATVSRHLIDAVRCVLVIYINGT